MSSRNRSLQGSYGGPGGTFMATTLCFKSGVLNQGKLCPQETLARDLFDHYWDRGATGIWWVEARHAAKHSTCIGHARNGVAQNLSSAEGEKPCGRQGRVILS